MLLKTLTYLLSVQFFREFEKNFPTATASLKQKITSKGINDAVTQVKKRYQISGSLVKEGFALAKHKPPVSKPTILKHHISSNETRGNIFS